MGNGGTVRSLNFAIGFGGNNRNLILANEAVNRFKENTQKAIGNLGMIKDKAAVAGRYISDAFNSTKKAISGGLDVLEKYKLELGLMAAAGTALILKTVKDAGDSAETINKFEVVFKDATKSTREWMNTWSASVGRSKYEAMDWLSSFESVFTAFGIGQQEASEYSKSLTALAVDLGSLYNVSATDAAHNLTSALVGNHEAVRSLNIVITEEDVKMAAYRYGIAKAGRELTSFQKVQGRMALFFERTRDAQGTNIKNFGSLGEMMKAYDYRMGDATRTSQSFNNQIQAFRANMRDLSVTFGGNFLGLFNSGLVALNKFMSQLTSKSNLSSVAWIVGVATAILGISAALAGVKAAWPFLKAVLFNPQFLVFAAIITGIILVVEDLWNAFHGGNSVLKPVVDWFKKYGNIVLWVAGIITAFFAPAILYTAIPAITSFVVTLVTSAIGGIISFGTTLWGAITAIWAFNVALWSNPIVWVTAIIIGLIAAIILLWKNWDKVCKWLGGAWNWVINGVISGFNWLLGLWDKLKNSTPDWIKRLFGWDKKEVTIQNKTIGNGLTTSSVTDNRQVSETSQMVNNSRQTKTTQVNNQVQIKVDGSKNPQETGKQVREELDRYFKEGYSSSVEGG